MAATKVCTASNGWVFRPLEETAADQDFFMRCWKDFPQGSTTYIARLNRFSRFLMENDKFNETNIHTYENPQLQLATYVSVKDGTRVGVSTWVFGASAGKMNVRFGIIDPTHRGNGYFYDQNILSLGMMETWNLTHINCWFQAPGNAGHNTAVSSTRTKWDNLSFDIDSTTTTSPGDFHLEAQDLEWNEATIAQYRTLKAADSGWASVTWAYS
jgi:hypothetical protein